MKPLKPQGTVDFGKELFKFISSDSGLEASPKVNDLQTLAQLSALPLGLVAYVSNQN